MNSRVLLVKELIDQKSWKYMVSLKQHDNHLDGHTLQIIKLILLFDTYKPEKFKDR